MATPSNLSTSHVIHPNICRKTETIHEKQGNSWNFEYALEVNSHRTLHCCPSKSKLGYLCPVIRKVSFSLWTRKYVLRCYITLLSPSRLHLQQPALTHAPVWYRKKDEKCEIDSHCQHTFQQALSFEFDKYLDHLLVSTYIHPGQSDSDTTQRITHEMKTFRAHPWHTHTVQNLIWRHFFPISLSQCVRTEFFLLRFSFSFILFYWLSI